MTGHCWRGSNGLVGENDSVICHDHSVYPPRSQFAPRRPGNLSQGEATTDADIFEWGEASRRLDGK